MYRTTIFLLIVSLFANNSFAAELEKYDSLFIQASAASYKQQRLLAPAQEKIILAGREAMPFLISKFTSQQPREYQALKDLFRKIKPELAAEFIQPVIQNKNRKTYGIASELLGIAGGKSISKLLYPDLESDSIWIRVSTIRSLGIMKDTLAEKLIAEQITHLDYRVRWQVAAALGKIATKYSLEKILNLTNDSLQIVKMTAFQYLKNNLKQLPNLEERSQSNDQNLILHRLNYLQNKSLYPDSAKFSPTQWRFIVNS